MKRSANPPLILLWLVGLLAVALATQTVITAHLTRVRGVVAGFPAPVSDADVPTLGVNVALEQYDEAALESALARIADGGFAWVRQSFYWSQIEPQPGGALSLSKGQYDWVVSDHILAALARHPELRLVAVLDDHGAATTPIPDPDRFAAFAREFAARYGEQVDYYQVWDEPNLAAHWGGGPINPPAYADLLAHTATAIRSADPGAHILLAGLAPTLETGPRNLSDVRYLEQLYQAGAAPHFDIVAGKPYGFDTGPDDRRVDERVLNFSRLLLLREVMEKHGDAGKALWASHWGWNALPPGWAGAPSLWGQTDEVTQAAYTARALDRARAEWPWCGVMLLEHFQPPVPPDDPHWGFALMGQDDTPRPVYAALAAWVAQLPDAAASGGYPVLDRWATYGGDWRLGDLGADSGSATGNRAEFRFEGCAVALTVRRGPYRASLYVSVDGQPANALPRDDTGRAYITLYDNTPAVATIPLATDLPPGLHTAEVIAEGGQGQWMLVDWRVGVQPVRDGFGWKLAGLIAAGVALAALVVRDGRRVKWAVLAQTFLAWPERAQVALAAGLTGLFWLTASAGWGQSLAPRSSSLVPSVLLPASCFLLSLLTLLALAALFSLRLDLGLALVAFTAPFYLQPGNLFYRAVSVPEVLVGLCAMGAMVRRCGGAAEIRRQGDKGRVWTFLDWAVLLWVVAAVVAGVVAADKKAALFELRAVFLLPALYYALLRKTDLDGRGWWRLVDGFVLGAVGVAVVGLVGYVLGRGIVAEGGLPRLQSVYASPNSAGLYLGRVWPILVAVAVWGGGAGEQGSRGTRRRLYVLALLPVTLALALTFSRGALLLGVPAALLAMGWRAGGRWRWAALALVALGALALIPLLRVPRFAALLDLRQGSTFFRLEVWRSSLAMIRDHPLFGIGPGNFQVAYRTRYMLPSAWAEPNLEHPHNLYLDCWTRLGILGVLAGLVVQIAFWRQIANQQINKSANLQPPTSNVQPPISNLQLGLTGSMAALLAHGLVDNALFFPDLALAFFLTLALARKGAGACPERSRRERRGKGAEG